MENAKVTARREAIRMIVIGGGLMIAGAVGLLVPFMTFTTAQDWNRLDDEVERFAWQASLSLGFTPTAKPVEDTEHRNITNRLSIPKIGVDMPVLEGGESVLWKGGWLFPGTALPGAEGNSVIFGHRFRYLPPVSNTFFKLDKLVAGDTFSVRWGGKSYSYRVITVSTVEPTDFSVLQPTPGASLMTLITCAPAFSTKFRLVVVGMLVP
jgi:sortase A